MCPYGSRLEMLEHVPTAYPSPKLTNRRIWPTLESGRADYFIIWSDTRLDSTPTA